MKYLETDLRMVDVNNRITLGKALMKEAHLKQGSLVTVALLRREKTVPKGALVIVPVIKMHENKCKMCGTTEQLTKIGKNHYCKDCLKKITEKADGMTREKPENCEVCHTRKVTKEYEGMYVCDQCEAAFKALEKK